MQEAGIRRLRAALASQASPQSMASHVVPLIKVLGHDSLWRGACKPALLKVLEVCYKVSGLLACLCSALKSGSISDPAPVGWFALTIASNFEDARGDPDIATLVPLLEGQQGAAANAAKRLAVVLAGSSGSGSASGSSGSATAGTSGSAGVAGGSGDVGVAGGVEGDHGGLALEDLAQLAGGRHDNDHADYRSIKIMVTSEEVSDSPRLHAMHGAIIGMQMHSTDSSLHVPCVWNASGSHSHPAIPYTICKVGPMVLSGQY